ncbi:MAG TPA: hypothetical protein VGR73_17755 [Bryobacteraceae bacterium]|nr:hypothetical protein [Bryobacteraceae bacterium]
MSEEDLGPVEKHDPREGFDRSDPHVRAIFVYTVVSLVVLVILIVAMQQYFEDIYQKAVYDKILSAPSEQLQELRNRDAWNLSHYMYGDLNQNSGRVRIPLDKAIELNLQDAQAGKSFYPAKPSPVKPVEPPTAPVPKYY